MNVLNVSYFWWSACMGDRGMCKMNGNPATDSIGVSPAVLQICFMAAQGNENKALHICWNVPSDRGMRD